MKLCIINITIVDIVFCTHLSQVLGTRVFNNGFVKLREDEARGGWPRGWGAFDAKVNKDF